MSTAVNTSALRVNDFLQIAGILSGYGLAILRSLGAESSRDISYLNNFDSLIF